MNAREALALYGPCTCRPTWTCRGCEVLIMQEETQRAAADALVRGPPPEQSFGRATVGEA